MTSPTLAFEPLPQLFQANFAPAEFAARRERVFDAIGDAVAIVQGAPAPAASEHFRQTNEFFYLCGVEVPHAYLLLDGRDRSATLYLPHRDHDLEPSEGPRLSSDDPDAVTEKTGIGVVAGVEVLAIDLQRLVLKRRDVTCFTPTQPAEGGRAMRDQLLRAAASAASDPWGRASTREAAFATRLRERFPQMRLSDLSPVLDSLRLLKSPAEVELLRHAGRLSALGVTEAMRCTAPGVMEFELAAVAAFCFTSGGARGDGYRAIVAAGKNAWFGHYGRLGSPLEDGDLVLMDYAPDVAYYTSDIGRMWPVNGRYDGLQRLLYGFMVEYHRELLRLVQPGAKAEAVLEEAAATMRERVEQLDFPEAAYKRAALAALKFPGHLSHPVGMSVHDVGTYFGEPLRPGTVFSVDPQLWVPEFNCYIRCEDTVLVTDDGLENLTAGAPLDPDEVELVMKEPSELSAALKARRSWQ